MQIQPAFCETHAIRRVYDEETETWWFSMVDIINFVVPSMETILRAIAYGVARPPCPVPG